MKVFHNKLSGKYSLNKKCISRCSGQSKAEALRLIAKAMKSPGEAVYFEDNGQIALRSVLIETIAVLNLAYLHLERGYDDGSWIVYDVFDSFELE